MAGERLFEFDLALCDYALGNVRRHLHGVAARPVPAPALRPEDWNRLDFPGWFGRSFATRLPALGDHVWAGVLFDDAPRLPLNDAELDALADAVADPPMRLDRVCVWEPYPHLHARAVECVPDVRDGLTRRTAEDWADASADFAARLTRGPLRLADGIDVVHEWLGDLRRLVRLMGHAHHLPSPLGTHPTPTAPAGPAAPGGTRRPRPDAPPARGGSGMLTPGQVAAGFAVSRSTVYAACRAGLLAHYRVPAAAGAAGKYLIREADALAWLESFRAGPRPPAPAPAAPAPAAPVPAATGPRPGAFSELDPDRLSRAWADRP